MQLHNIVTLKLFNLNKAAILLVNNFFNYLTIQLHIRVKGRKFL